MHFFSVALHDEGRVAGHRTIGGHIFAHHSTGANHGTVADGDAAIDDGTGVDAHTIANGGTATASVAQRHVLQAVEVAAYVFGIQIRGIVVLEMGSLPYFRAPDVECPFGR